MLVSSRLLRRSGCAHKSQLWSQGSSRLPRLGNTLPPLASQRALHSGSQRASSAKPGPASTARHAGSVLAAAGCIGGAVALWASSWTPANVPLARCDVDSDGFPQPSSPFDPNYDAHESDHSSSGLNRNPGAPLGRNFVADAVDVAFPAVVNISTVLNGPWGMVGRGSGSGFIVSRDGYVVTNHHVVTGAKAIKITLSDGREFKGEVHSTDELTDLALVRIINTEGEAFPVLEFGRSDKLRVGEWVVALGSPMTLSNTVTCGIVSSAGRDPSDLGLKQKTDYIQTDAAINQGNSGGPLINLDGKVIGINTMKLAGAGGISFAIPIDAAAHVIAQLKANKVVARPYLGLRMLALSGGVARQEKKLNGLPEGVEHGVLVVKVAAGSPGEHAGLRSGDVITKFDDKPVFRIFDIVKGLGFHAGSTHTLTVARKGSSTLTISVTSTTGQHDAAR